MNIQVKYEPPLFEDVMGYRFGCLQPDKDGRWYFPIYSGGKMVGKSYASRSHWVSEGSTYADLRNIR